MIDKIECHKRIGCDKHTNLIDLLVYMQSNSSDIQDRISEEEYKKVKDNRENYPSWYVGLVGFCASYGAKFFGGYARDSRDDNSGKWSEGAIRNIKKQAENIKDVEFLNIKFQDLQVEKLSGYLIYCDIPYRDTTKYSTGKFSYEEFYEWVKTASKKNTVLISEYSMPGDFECIWEKETKTLIGSDKQKRDNVRVEKLFIYKN